jgi:hypothetical protein
MLVKLPMWLNTLWKASGRSHATVNAQMPPELAPAIARWSGSVVRLYFLPTSGSSSSMTKRA